MLPVTLELPVAVLVLVGGLLACFAGHRLFRIVLALVGFIVGALLASSFFGGDETTPMIVAGLVGGLVGAGLLIGAYFVGVALVGAGIGAVVANIAFAAGGGDPSLLAVAGCALAGALLAMYLQRYVIIVGTAFAGAWMIILGALVLIDRQAFAAVNDDIWVLYPLTPSPGREWVPVAWVALGIVGLVSQMGVTAGPRGRVGRARRG
ncbi:MAG: DUF4203 domain-containing protein [Vicinamibacterales bacterium]